MSNRIRPDKTGPAFPSSRRWRCSWLREAGIFPPEALPRAVATLFWSEPEAWQNWRRCESPRCGCRAVEHGLFFKPCCAHWHNLPFRKLRERLHFDQLIVTQSGRIRCATQTSRPSKSQPANTKYLDTKNARNSQPREDPSGQGCRLGENYRAIVGGHATSPARVAFAGSAERLKREISQRRKCQEAPVPPILENIRSGHSASVRWQRPWNR